jgi:hypothetical protein
MIQIRSGDLITVQENGNDFLFAVLTKQVLFGGHWCFVFYDLSQPHTYDADRGFYAFVDFRVPKRTNRISKQSSRNDFDTFTRPNLLKQQPTRGEKNYVFYRWIRDEPHMVEQLRSTPSPTSTELDAPEYACVPADWACELAVRRWKPRESMWIA